MTGCNARGTALAGFRMHSGRPWLRSCGIAVALFALASPAAAQILRGTVADSASGQPLSGAHVSVLNARGVTVRDTVTGASGDFTFDLPVIGSYRVRAVRIGYAGRITEPIGVDAKLESRIRLVLRPNPLSLDTLTVVAESVATEQWVPWLADVRFYDRRHKGFGHFLTRQEIEKKQPEVVTDLLRDMPGIRLACPSRRSCSILMPAAGLMFIGKTCAPTVVLDGAVVSVGGTGGSGDVNWENPHDLEAIEVYPSPAGLPVQYAGYMSPCGAVLLWSRR